MKHRIALAAFSLSLVLILCACIPKPQVTVTSSAAIPTPSPSQSASLSPSTSANVSSSDAIDEKVRAMEPVLDSIARAMSELNTSYAPADSSYFWTTLYLLSNNFGSQYPGITKNDSGSTVVSTKTMQELAAACFSTYSKLLALPDDLSSVTYDADADQYVCSPSDMSDAKCTVTACEKNADGSLAVTLTVTDATDTAVASYAFTLVDNPSIAQAASPIYYYSVSKASAQ